MPTHFGKDPSSTVKEGEFTGNKRPKKKKKKVKGADPTSVVREGEFSRAKKSMKRIFK